jgi:predicted nuclease of predicted toxin-antitoxin system
MRPLANENFPITSVKHLSEAGFDIVSISLLLPGSSDAAVMEMASGENRTIITFDRDYGELIFKQGFRPVAGVIFIRWSDFTPEEPGEYLIGLFSEKRIDFENALTVIDKNSIRQRKY